jgi:hypothetical protein
MAFLRRSPLVTVAVDLYPGSRAAVTITPRDTRWPEHEETDRLVTPLGFALARAGEEVMGQVRIQVRHAAAAIADPDLAAEPLSTLFIAVSGLQMSEPGQAGANRIVAKLIRSPVGPVPTLGGASPAPSAIANAATAALAVALAPAALDLRLAAALSLEGLLGWYQIADPHLQPPQQAVAYSVRHAAARLAEQGRAAPDALAAAVHQQRKVSPMAGGA